MGKWDKNGKCGNPGGKNKSLGRRGYREMECKIT